MQLIVLDILQASECGMGCHHLPPNAQELSNMHGDNLLP